MNVPNFGGDGVNEPIFVLALDERREDDFQREVARASPDGCAGVLRGEGAEYSCPQGCEVEADGSPEAANVRDTDPSQVCATRLVDFGEDEEYLAENIAVEL